MHICRYLLVQILNQAKATKFQHHVSLIPSTLPSSENIPSHQVRNQESTLFTFITNIIIHGIQLKNLIDALFSSHDGHIKRLILMGQSLAIRVWLEYLCISKNIWILRYCCKFQDVYMIGSVRGWYMVSSLTRTVPRLRETHVET